jgi:protein disulfide-isomerase A6
MKPDWDKLGQQYANSDSVMIVDVDCTSGGEQTCQKHGVQGYPTIQYFMAGKKKGTAYQGGRDFDSLKQLVASKLDKPVCNAVTKKGCQKAEVEWIDKQEGTSLAELSEILVTKSDELKAIKKEKADAEKEFKEKEKEWKKKEKNLLKATGYLKQLEAEAKKQAKKAEKAEL